MSEYNVIDLFDQSIRFRSSDFETHRIHTLCLMSYYLYEQEFVSRRIRVHLGRSQDSCHVNFSTARTAISQIFDNCLKYCKPETDINISFVIAGPAKIEMRFEMTSLFFENAKVHQYILPGVRGEFAELLDNLGKGAGLGIIQRMMDLNRGYFTFRSFDNTKVFSGAIPYSSNEFVLGFERY